MPDTLSLMSSLRDVASRINADADVDTLLHSLIELACHHGSWDLGSIMSVDIAHGYALVIARRDPTLLKRALADRWELATSPALVALQRNEPVYIRDALETTEFLGYRREAPERGYRTVLVLPMASCDAEGRPMVLVVSARKVVDVAPEHLAFMELVVHLGAIAIERAHRQRAQQAAAEQLRRVLSVQGAMLQEVLVGGSMDTLTGMLADLLDSPVLVIDFYGGELLASRPPVEGSTAPPGAPCSTARPAARCARPRARRSRAMPCGGCASSCRAGCRSRPTWNPWQWTATRWARC